MIPKAFVGVTGGGIYQLDAGHTDDGAEIPFRAETNALAPGGASADHAFDWLRATFTHTAPAQITLTAVVDGVDVDDKVFLLDVQTERVTETVEAAIRAVEERAEYGARTFVPRGTWLSVRVEVILLGAGDLIVDGVEVDYEVLTPTKRRV